MRQMSVWIYRFLFFSCFLVFMFTPFTASAESCEQWIARAVSVEGSIELKKHDETDWYPVKFDDVFCAGDTIRVLELSRADLVLQNESILRLDQNTTVVINGLKAERTMLMNIVEGIGYFFSRFRRSLEVFTPFVNGTVEGTEFLLKVESDNTLITVFEGIVLAENDAGSISLQSGQSAVAQEGKAPELQIVAKPRDAVQWALYYPTVLYEYPEDLQEDDPRFYTSRASMLLQVGRVDEAGADIEKALSMDSNNSQAFALQSIIAVVQNDKDKALSLAEKAVEADPQSASAHIALSYAQQARFDLRGALESLKEVTSLEPEHALAWARLAELQMSHEELDEALKAAHRAVEIDPDIARSQTVLGFAYLTQVKIKRAKEAFRKAIELDQADPLPHLGLGLAEIRKGCVEEGRKEIEIAASLDPDNALIRSYLGKSYYEEKKDNLTSEQYEMANEFDPKDPTPYFYDAIRKQTINRTVEALHDMQKAIELNDNRAVYRSKLLLDSDLAARSASLARIYSDLGFEQLALVEGWKSVNTDPSDFSGHRFLADMYSTLPRHEIARVSELLQAQLLQPINITPIQPHLAESDLYILEGAGPADLSFNEFNPLFNRNRYSLQISGIVGEQETFGEEIVVSAVQNNISLSAGQFHYETDGWRENNDQKQDIYNVFTQVALSYKTSVQAEFRATDKEYGDLELRFFPGDFIPNARFDDTTRSFRIGFHHALSHRSRIISSLMYQNAEFAYNNIQGPVAIDIKQDLDSYSAELQHLYHPERFSIISGVGHFKINRDERVTTEIFLPPPIPPQKSSEVKETDVSHTNFYIYSNIKYPRNVTITIGGSADFFEGSQADQDQFNPKIGMNWNILSKTTLRAAIFRVLKRTLITNQTLEPTQVAGFNQFYDENEGTDSWKYGIAIDHNFTKNIYAGLEYSFRHIETPFNYLPDPTVPIFEVKGFEWEEYLARAYLYWTPHQWLTLSAEYFYEKLDREVFLMYAGIDQVKTHRVPVALNFSHPSGLSATLKTTYTDQEGMLIPQGSLPGAPSIKGSDQFWIVDVAISYRLPKRLGLLKIGAKNLFDESFKYQDTDYANPKIQPERLIFAKITLAI